MRERDADPGVRSRASPEAAGDHFSGHAEQYLRFRPGYPPQLYRWLVQQLPGPGLAWDCGTGSGQVAAALVEHLEGVWATDISPQQLAQASSHPRIRYRAGSASASGLDPHSVVLVTAAQALHWFPPAGFHREVERVLRPGGIVAAWCYQLFQVHPPFDREIRGLYDSILGADWPAERRHVDEGYARWPWPWELLETPEWQLSCRWTLGQTLGYLRTWSAAQRWKTRHGRDPLLLVEERLRASWGEEEQRTLSWPLQILVSRMPS